MSEFRKNLLAVSALILSFGTSSAFGSAVAIDLNNDREWSFRVFLDDAEIGYHNYSLTEDVDSQRITSAADFKVKFLFITAYQYKHKNTETWQGGCLQQIDATTDANGKDYQVSGIRQSSGFSLEANAVQEKLGECVKTFAYWNQDFLQASELLNAQTGELLSVQVSPAEQDLLTIGGQQIAAMKYHLTAKNVDLNVWYSGDRRWLALESTVKGGRKLRYELSAEQI